MNRPRIITAPTVDAGTINVLGGIPAPNGINQTPFTDTFTLSPRANWGPNWLPRCTLDTLVIGSGDLIANSVNPGGQWIQGPNAGSRNGEALPLPLSWMIGQSLNQFVELTVGSVAVPASTNYGASVLWTPFYDAPRLSGTVAGSGGYLLTVIGATLQMALVRTMFNDDGTLQQPYNVFGLGTIGNYTLGQVVRVNVTIAAGIPTFTVIMNGVTVGAPTPDNNAQRTVIGCPAMAQFTSSNNAGPTISRFSGGRL
jgi:hypothetical protein